MGPEGDTIGDTSRVEADLVVTNARLVTMDADRRIVEGGAIAVRGGEIVGIASAATAARWPAQRVVDAGGGLVTPGFVNAHQHVTGGPLVWSCIPDNLGSGESIFYWSVPLHEAETPRDEELSAMLVAAESMRAGTTTLVEAGTITHAEAVASGLERSGIRATVGTWAWDNVEGSLNTTAAEAFRRLGDILDAHPKGGRVEGWVTLIGHNLATDDLLVGAAELALERGVGMTMHLSPTSSDPEAYLARNGCRPVVHLERLGVLGRHLLIGHGVWLDDEEIDAVLASGTAIAYCPWAYFRMGQGVAANGRHAEIVRRGGRVALGCDAVNSADSVDLLRAASLAAGLAKDQRVDASWFGAHEAIEMLTCAGAEAIGMADRIGSLEVGKKADLVVFETDSPHWVPDADPALSLVWSSDGRHVRHVVIDGRLVVEDGRCLTMDEDALRQEARKASADLLARASLRPPVRWPVERPV